jgi:hypothetical protein
MIHLEEMAEEQRLARLWLDANARPGEDWDVLVDRDRVYLRTSVDDEVRRHELSLARLKAILIAVYSGTIDRVRVTIPSDAQRGSGTDLLIWLTSTAARWEKFRVASYPIEKGTSELVAAFRLAEGGAV